MATIAYPLAWTAALALCFALFSAMARYGVGDALDTITVNGKTCSNGICVDQFDHWQTVPMTWKCRDLRDDCTLRAVRGLCQTDSLYTHPHCPVACGVCHNRTREIPFETSAPFSPHPRNRQGLVEVAGSRFGVPQLIPERGSDDRQGVLDRMQDAHEYWEDVVMEEDRYQPVRTLCRNEYELCALWAARGECTNNERFMKKSCPVVCYTCETLHVDALCPFDPNIPNAWQRGDLNRMFKRIVHDSTLAHYQTTVLSRPDYEPNDTAETASYQIGPWVVIIDDFLNETETSTLIALGADQGYERSTDVGEILEDGSYEDDESETRTSTNAWCYNECDDHEVTQIIWERMTFLTQIPPENSESLQMLRYEPGQFYAVHHDYIENDWNRAVGSRILTVFLYLNDVEEGGATNFPELELAVQPKRGRALLWPSVLDQYPHKKDDRTEHEAQVVTKGIKYGANAWFHQRDYQGSTQNGC